MKPKEEPKKEQKKAEYSPPKIVEELDLETHAGSPCTNDPDPLDLFGNPCD